MSLLGIDVGSSSCKGLAFDLRGKIIAKAEIAYAISTPGPARAELDAEVFWNATIQVIRTIAQKTTADPVEALALASHGETFIPLDGHGQPLSAAIMNSDNRAVAQTNLWKETLGMETLYNITGLPLHSMFTINKIQWLKENQPDIWHKTVHLVGPADYILMKMGFSPVTDYSLASRMMAFDIRAKQWSDVILDRAGICKGALPTPLPAGQLLGRLSAETASVLGLRTGVSVSLGGHDQPCGALGAGTVDAGQVADSAGSFECLSITSDQPLDCSQALKYSLNSYCHVIPDRYITLAFFPSGLMVRWFVEQFCGIDALEAAAQEKNVYEVLAEKVAKEQTSSAELMVLPHLIGACNPHWDVHATGMIAGLTLDVSRVRLYRAVFEGIACDMALNIEVMQQCFGDFDSVKIFGGNAQSSFSVQLRADISGKRMKVMPHAEMVCQGAAILAGIGGGQFKNVFEGLALVPKTVAEYVPQEANRQMNRDRVLRYADLFHSLSSFRSNHPR